MYIIYVYYMYIYIYIYISPQQVLPICCSFYFNTWVIYTFFYSYVALCAPTVYMWLCPVASRRVQSEFRLC